MKFVFVDTAGLRKEAIDQVEIIGINRSKKAMGESDINIFVFNLEQGLTSDDLEILNELEPRETLILGNKSDLRRLKKEDIFESFKAAGKFFQKFQSCEGFLDRQVRIVSALDIKDRSAILEMTVNLVLDQESVNDEILITNARHFENLSLSLEHLQKAEKNLHNKMGAEFIAMDLKEAVLRIQQILGKAFDDQIMDRVFKEFCLGK